MTYNPGDQITMGGIVYTYNGTSWTYVVNKYPKSVTTTATFAGTPTPDLVSELGSPITTDIPNLEDTYDWEVLSRLAMGAIYANEVQVSH